MCICQLTYQFVKHFCEICLHFVDDNIPVVCDLFEEPLFEVGEAIAFRHRGFITTSSHCSCLELSLFEKKGVST